MNAHVRAYLDQKKHHTAWLKAYLKALSEGRGASLICTGSMSPRQLGLFKEK